TAIVCAAEPVLPAASVADHVIVVVPTGYVSDNALPSERTPVAVTVEQLSVAVAVPGLIAAAHLPTSLPCEMAGGAVTIGFSVSAMVMVWTTVPMLPASSVADQVIVVVPT